MAEEKKTPAEVWKILPVKHKIISVVVAVVVASVTFFIIYYATPKEVPKLGFGGLTPARDLTGTWRNGLSGQGLVEWGTYPTKTSDSLQYISGSDPRYADFAYYYDVKWDVTQSGNTVAGYMVITKVKASTPGVRIDSEPNVIGSGTYYATGIVEGSSITIKIVDVEIEHPEAPPGAKMTIALKGGFTTDIMTLQAHVPTEWKEGEYGGLTVTNPPPDYRFKLSLSRVW